MFRISSMRDTFSSLLVVLQYLSLKCKCSLYLVLFNMIFCTRKFQKGDLFLWLTLYVDIKLVDSIFHFLEMEIQVYQLTESIGRMSFRSEIQNRYNPNIGLKN